MNFLFTTEMVVLNSVIVKQIGKPNQKRRQNGNQAQMMIKN